MARLHRGGRGPGAFSGPWHPDRTALACFFWPNYIPRRLHYQNNDGGPYHWPDSREMFLGVSNIGTVSHLRDSVEYVFPRINPLVTAFFRITLYSISCGPDFWISYVELNLQDAGITVPYDYYAYAQLQTPAPHRVEYGASQFTFAENIVVGGGSIPTPQCFFRGAYWPEQP